MATRLGWLASRRFNTRQNVETAFALSSKKSSKKPGLLSSGGYEYRSPSSPISVTQSAGSPESTNENRRGGYKNGRPASFKRRSSSASMPITTYGCPNVRSLYREFFFLSLTIMIYSLALSLLRIFRLQGARTNETRNARRRLRSQGCFSCSILMLCHHIVQPGAERRGYGCPWQ